MPRSWQPTSASPAPNRPLPPLASSSPRTSASSAHPWRKVCARSTPKHFPPPTWSPSSHPSDSVPAFQERVVGCLAAAAVRSATAHLCPNGGVSGHKNRETRQEKACPNLKVLILTKILTRDAHLR